MCNTNGAIESKKIEFVTFICVRKDEYMINVILYEISQQEGYSLEKLVDSFMQMGNDDVQGIIVREYDEFFLKASYWRRKLRKEKRYNFQTKDFYNVKEEIVDISVFDMQIKERKLLIFGNKQMAQRIITLIGLLSQNSYSITEHIIDIGSISKKICVMPEIKLLKVKLIDIIIDKEVIVDCNIDLMIQDRPEDIVLKYADNIIQVSFKIDGVDGKISIYKSGRFSATKLHEEERDELIQKIIQIVC